MVTRVRNPSKLSAERSLANTRRVTKKVTKRLRDRRVSGLPSGRGRGRTRESDVLDDFSGIPAGKRSNRPKDDPFNQIGL